MFSLPMLGVSVALGLAGWAAWFAILYAQAASRAQDELRALRLELVTKALRAADEQAAKETALRLLDALTVQRAEDVQALQARLQALEHKYHVTRQLYQDSIAIDGPLASRRVQ
jgi:hypothetical protein